MSENFGGPGAPASQRDAPLIEALQELAEQLAQMEREAAIRDHQCGSGSSEPGAETPPPPVLRPEALAGQRGPELDEALRTLAERIEEMVKEAQAVSGRLPRNNSARFTLEAFIAFALILVKAPEEKFFDQFFASVIKMHRASTLTPTTRLAPPLTRDTGLEQLVAGLVQLAKDVARLSKRIPEGDGMGPVLQSFSDIVRHTVDALYEVFPALKSDVEPRGLGPDPAERRRRAAFLGNHPELDPYLFSAWQK